jgi:hypothetical protein
VCPTGEDSKSSGRLLLFRVKRQAAAQGAEGEEGAQEEWGVELVAAKECSAAGGGQGGACGSTGLLRLFLRLPYCLTLRQIDKLCRALLPLPLLLLRPAGLPRAEATPDTAPLLPPPAPPAQPLPWPR